MTDKHSSPGNELLPCPFCGDDAQLLNGGPGNWYVRCAECKVSTNDVQRDLAIDLWNKRTAIPAQGAIGPREVLDALADKVSAKIGQLEHYKANDCQLDHARTIAEGRISQANQILHWIAEVAVSHSPSVPSTERQST